MEVGSALGHVGDMPNSRMGQHNTELTLSLPTDLPDRYSGGAPGDEKKVRRHIVEPDAHRDALRQAHPAEGRIDERQQLAAGAAVLVLDAVSDALDVPRQHARIADQFYSRILADTNAPQLGFLEITLDAVRVGIDQRKDSCAVDSHISFPFLGRARVAPCSPYAITTEWLTAVLCGKVPGAIVTYVE